MPLPVPGDPNPGPLALATVADVEARWRPLTPAEQIVAEARIDDASTWLRTLRPDVDARITAGDLSANAAMQVVVAAVKRSMIGSASGADGVRQESVGTGPYSTSRTYVNPTGSLYFTDSDLLLIDGYQAAGMSVRYSN